MEWMIMPLKRYAEFSGRSRRKEYWMFVLGIIVLWIVVMVLFTTVFGGMAMMQPGLTSAGLFSMMLGFGAFGLFCIGLWLALLIPSLAVTVRRLHDTDRSGWWIFILYGPSLLSMVLSGQGSAGIAAILSLLSLVGGVVLLVFMCLEGTRGPNRFGADPKGPDHAEVFA